MTVVRFVSVGVALLAVATAGFVQGSYSSSAFGMGQGFDLYQENATPGLRFALAHAFAWLDETLDALIEAL